MTSLRDYDVSISFARLDELQIHRLDSLGLSLDYPFCCLASLRYVPGYDSHHSVVIVRIHEQLDVHLVAELRTGEDEDALHDDHICRLYSDCLILGTGTCDVGIDRLLHTPALSELVDMLAEQLEIYRVRVVEIVVTFLLLSAVAEILLVCILRNHYHILLQLLSDCLHYSCFAGTGSSGYSYYHHILLV